MKALNILFLLCTISLTAQSDSTQWNQGMRYILSGQMYIESGQSNIGGSIEGLYFIKPNAALGAIIAYAPYQTSLRESMLNAGIEGLWTPKGKGRFMPFVAFASGIGFLEQADIGNNATLDPVERIFIQPKIGFTDVSSSGLGLVLSLGYIRQGLHVDFEGFDQEISLDYNRYVLSLGLTF